MIQKTKAIVINSIKYSDSSLIVNCYTENYGLKAYMLKGILKAKKGKVRKSLFQPLTQLELVAYHNNKGNLNSIKEAQITAHYLSLHTDIIKQSIVLFLSEVLSTSLREEEQNESLYHFLETAFLWLDTHDGTANFHLLFLLQLTKHLGFYPSPYNGELFFDLIEGKFLNQPLSNQYVKSPEINYLETLLGTTFEILPTLEFNASQRQLILDLLIRYINLHLHTFRTPKSLAILHVLFK